MASLLFAASYLTYNKIKTKREEKKEKKRKAYADRYHELEKEQMKDVEKQILLQQRTGESSRPSAVQFSPAQSPTQPHGRRSSESVRSEVEKANGPTAFGGFVTGGQNVQSSDQEPKVQSLI